MFDNFFYQGITVYVLKIGFVSNLFIATCCPDVAYCSTCDVIWMRKSMDGWIPVMYDLDEEVYGWYVESGYLRPQ